MSPFASTISHQYTSTSYHHAVAATNKPMGGLVNCKFNNEAWVQIQQTSMVQYHTDTSMHQVFMYLCDTLIYCAPGVLLILL